MGETVDISVPAQGVRAVELLEAAGFEAWLVGGFVRDAVRCETVHDLDIATAATWQEAEALFGRAGCAVHETGVSFGTITVVVDGLPIEVTTYRSDGSYRDARHPESVSFVGSIEEDLARRDFTVNAMAFHPVRGLVDPHGGLQDIASRTIRAVGDPQTRFEEDALRILRGVRFCAQLGYTIEPATRAAMAQACDRLSAVSVERCFSEFERLLLGDFAGDALLACPDILCTVVPAIAEMAGCPQNTPYHKYDVLGHTARVVDASPVTPTSRWAALFHDAGKPRCRRTDERGRDHFKGHAAAGAEIARETLARLKAPTALRQDVAELVRLHEWFVPDTDESALRVLRKLQGNVSFYRALLALQVADSSAKAPGATERGEAARRMQARLDRVLAEERPFTVAQLALGGDDLIAAGWQPGPALGAMLGELLEQVIAGRLRNSADELLSYASLHKAR